MYKIIMLLLTVATVSGAEIILENFAALKGWSARDTGAKFSECAGPDGGNGLRFEGPGYIQQPYPVDWQKRLDWNRCKGISFKIKGDGSDNFGCITLMGRNSWYYSWYFPLESKEWREYTVPWSDLTPGSDTISGEFNTPGNLTVDGISGIRFGDRWKIAANNRKIEPFCYQIADIRLVENAAPKYEIGRYQPPPFSQFRDKLRSGKPLKIYCYGDSITAGTSLKNPDEERYAVRLQELLRGGRDIQVRSFGVGGAHLYDVIGWMERDLADAPDLITIMIGYNNKSSAQPPEVFRRQLELWIDRVVAKTHGQTNILLIPTLPGCGSRYHMQDDLAQVVRDVARERNLPLCPVDLAFKKGGMEQISGLMADTAHPNAAGHRLFAETLADYLIAN